MSKPTGRSPAEARAIDLLRRGVSLVGVQDLLNVPAATVKRWAKKAGIAVTRPTPEQLADMHERRREARSHLRATTLSITAEMVGAPRRRGLAIQADKAPK